MVIISAVLFLGYPFLIASKISEMLLSSPKFAKRHGDLYSFYRNTIWCFETKKILPCNMTGFKTNCKKITDNK